MNNFNFEKKKDSLENSMNKSVDFFKDFEISKGPANFDDN